MPQYTTITPQIADRIRDAVGSDRVFDDRETLSTCSKDTSELHFSPELVVHASTTEQVHRLLQLANRHRFPVTPRGAGTGLAGGAIPALGGVVLSLAEMKRILSIDTSNLIAEVEPGVITKDLRDAAHAKGLFYPPDPASLDTSTIGGNAATNAGGPACVKYGTTRDYILGLEAVLPTGEVIRAGVQTRKGVVGYDLTHLIVGSEGTLGVITGLTLKLIPHPPAVASLAAVFPDLRSAIRTVPEIMTRGLLPSAVEFMDFRCLELVGDLLPFPISGGETSMLLLETDGTEDQTASEIARIGEICREMGASELLPAPTPEDRERVWTVRRQISLRIHDYAGVYMSEDVAVPIARIPDLIDLLPDVEKRFNVRVFSFGHAGDGNVHLNFTAVGPEHKEAMERGIREVIGHVLAMGGTMSGEHGVGLAKQPFIGMELPGPVRHLQKGIKRLFDPNMILNPAKIFDWEQD